MGSVRTACVCAPPGRAGEQAESRRGLVLAHGGRGGGGPRAWSERPAACTAVAGVLETVPHRQRGDLCVGRRCCPAWEIPFNGAPARLRRGRPSRACGAQWPQVQVQTPFSLLVSVAHSPGAWVAPQTQTLEEAWLGRRRLGPPGDRVTVRVPRGRGSLGPTRDPVPTPLWLSEPRGVSGGSRGRERLRGGAGTSAVDSCGNSPRSAPVPSRPVGSGLAFRFGVNRGVVFGLRNCPQFGSVSVDGRALMLC